MLLVRIDFAGQGPQPTTIAHVASIPSAGDYLAFDEANPLYVQRAVIVVDPKPGQPVALIRLTE